MPGLLVHSPARIFAECLIAAGYGTDPERTLDGVWPVYISREPDIPDELIKISNTMGKDYGFSQPDKEFQEHQGIQVMVRSVNDEEGYYKAQQIAIFIDQLQRYLVSILESPNIGTANVSYMLHAVTRTGNIIPLGSDTPAGKRQLFTINATVAIRLCCVN